MCNFFSCVVINPALARLRGIPEIAFTEGSDHETLVNRLALDDSKIEDRDFVRVECFDGVLDRYTEDEEYSLPRWYHREDYLTRMGELLEKVNEAEKKAYDLRQEYFAKRRTLSEHKEIGIIKTWETLQGCQRRLRNATDKKIQGLYSGIKGYVGPV